MDIPSMNVDILLKYKFLHNSILQYLTAAGTFALIFFVSCLLRRIIISRLKAAAEKTATKVDDFLVSLLAQIRIPEFFFLALYFGSRALSLNPSVGNLVKLMLVLALTYRAIKILQAGAAFAINSYTENMEWKDAGAASAQKNISMIINWALWLAGALFILDNLGVKISAAVAGLGIGGVAVALACQAILGDLFNSFVIYMDKPFRIGDFIIVGDMMGVVEHIGIKTTRVRSLGGEGLVFSNTDLTNSRIRNYKKMKARRVVFRVGVTYQTSAAKLKKIPALVAEIFKSVENAKLDRVHFVNFGDFSLDFEIVYYVSSGDYGVYMDCQQAVNLAIYESFEKEAVDFAYPTQSLYLEKGDIRVESVVPARQ